ncbi:hypothetical protein LCGC14_2583090, partial [marine sediment metagenome]
MTAALHGKEAVFASATTAAAACIENAL